MVKKFLLAFLVLFAPISFASLQVELSRDTLSKDEVLTLVISSSDHISISPDISPLKKDFDVVGTSQNSQFNIINGVTQMQTQWQIALIPKRAGDIIIPPIQVGSERTGARIVHVVDVKKIYPQEISHDQDVFLQASVVPKETFIQEQFVYTVKLFFSRTIENPYLMPPELADAKIVLNGQDILYTAVKDGKYYRVLERSYLITPQNTGSFTIQPPILKGYMEGPRDLRDVYGFSSHALKPIKISGPALEIKVKPKPANFVGKWLPAKKITIEESWEPNPPIFREGEPITQVVEIKAEGATGEQIPALSIPAVANLNSYPQTPKRETNVNGNLQVGKMTQKIVYIPTKAGKITLPAIKVNWWNSTLQKEQTAIIPQKTIDVLPALAQSSASNSVATVQTTPAISKTIQALPKKERSLFWPIVAIIFMAIWLITLLLWRRQLKTKPGKPLRSASDLQAQIKTACQANNPKQVRNRLLEWARQYWKNPEINSLVDITHHLELEGADTFLKEIMQLEGVFYGRNPKKWDGTTFWEAFQEYLHAGASNITSPNTDPLPPLYY